MTNERNEKKPGIKLSPTLISMIVGALLIAGRFWSVASTATEVRLEIRQLQKEVVELKDSHTTFKEVDEKLSEIKERLVRIETHLDIEKE